MKTTRNSMLVVALVVTLGLLFSGTAFGVNGTMMLGDYVWVDSNEDGIQDSDESGVEDVTVTLYKYLKRNDGGFYYITDQVGVTTTNADGWYEFADLGWGLYYLEFDLPSGYQWTTQDATGATDANDSDVDASGKTDDFPMGGVLVGYEPNGIMIWEDGEHVDDLTRDAGLIVPPPCTMSLGDYVWVDTDGDGTQDETGTGVGGVGVELYEHQSDSSGELVGTQMTDGDGYYLFTDLEEGEYYLVFSTPGGFEWTAKDSGADDSDSDVDVTGKTDPFYLDADECNDDLTRDAGLVESTFTNPGCGTPGYWKNHAKAWPVEEITIGGTTYSKAAAIKIMKKATKKDMSTIMFMHLVAAKLNVLIGNSDLIIGEYIVAADAWMSVNASPMPGYVRASSSTWRTGEPIKDMLDDYNNGRLDAPARD